MAEKRIIELTNEKLSLSDGDYTIVDSNDGTYKFKPKRIVDAIPAIDSTLTQTGKAADAKAVGDEIADVKRDLNDKANIDGTYDGMTIGNAKQILSEKYLLDEEPYLFRASGGDGADRVEECIVGGTVAWNQLFPRKTINYEGEHISMIGTNSSSALVFTIGENIESETSGIRYYSETLTDGHKYFIGNFGDANDGTRLFFSLVTLSRQNSIIAGTGSALGTLRIQCTNVSAGTYTYYPMIIDLTTMFGSAIADYIYSLEQATAGAGVAFFRKYFPKDYYEYSAPTLRHVEGVSAKEVTGWNQWDEEWELGSYSTSTGAKTTATTLIRNKTAIAALPNTPYFFKTSNAGRIFFYDENAGYLGNAVVSANSIFTTPETCRFICFQVANTTTYNHDICISLSDPTKNGQYEPYHKNIYPLDSTLTLRGIPKLTDGKMWFDGDRYNADGTVERNTILRAYQEGDESLANAITDGTNTVVYSANASAETATPYTSIQMLDPHGTEEFVSTGIVPVGHKSHYLENLRSKIEGLPRDFSTLIAPTEKAYKATQNYTVGSLLIVDNILYKVTAAIANGGTITPNTNCTATTLAAVIAALA